LATSTSAVKQRFVEDVVEIPEGISAESREKNSIVIRGKLGELSRTFINAGVEISLSDGKINVRVYGKGRRATAVLNTVKSHIRNMFIGVTEGFTYKMKIVYSHFPISVKLKDNAILIENFIGEKIPRRVEIPAGVKASVKGDEILLFGIDKEAVGLAAGRIEEATKIRHRDPRKYLDGIYIYEKIRGMTA